MSHRKMRFFIVAATILGILGISGGIALADIPDSGVVNACYDAKGTLQVIDKSTGQSCSGTQTPISWASQGGYVYLGQVNYAWDTMSAPVTLAPQQQGIAMVGCNQGDIAIGANSWMSDTSATYGATPSWQYMRLVASQQADTGNASNTGYHASDWVVVYDNTAPTGGNSYTVNAQAVCWHPES